MILTPLQRRREQNRIAQRTFRERKDRYIQNLEGHIKELNTKHQDLLMSYKRSTEQVTTLYTQLLDIQSELDYLRSTRAQDPSSPADLPQRGSVSYTNSPQALAMMQAQPSLQPYCPPPDYPHMLS
jgi:hypothetical protein